MLESFKTALYEAYEGSLRSILLTIINRKNAYMYMPEPDKQTLVQDRIISELENTIKFFEKKKIELQKEKIRQKSKVDYTWLMNIPYKKYKIPSLERMEIETIAYQIRPEDVGLCIRRFKDQIIRSTVPGDIPNLMMQTLRKLLDDYEVEKYTTEFTRNTFLRRIRSESKVYPSPELFEMTDSVVITNCSSDNVNCTMK